MNEHYSIIDIFGIEHIINLKEVHSYETFFDHEPDFCKIHINSLSENDSETYIALSYREYEKWKKTIDDYWCLKIRGFLRPKPKRKSLFIIIEEG